MKNLLICVLVLTLFALPASAQTQVKLWANGNTGNITGSGQSIEVSNARGQAAMGIGVTGTFTGTMIAECSVDGTNYLTGGLTLQPILGGDSVASFTTTGGWQANITACKTVRVRATAWTSGTAVVTLDTFQVSLASSTSITGTFSGNDAAGLTGSAVPTSADLQGVDIAGVLTGQTGVTVGSHNAATVAIVDSSGNQIDAFGGGIQYTEADTDASITGTAILFECNTGTNALCAISNTTPLPISDAGTTLDVAVSGTVASAQSGNWSVRTQDGSGNALTSATRGSERALSVQVVDASGNQVVPVAGKAEDAVHASADVGNFVLGVRSNTTPSSTAGSAGDYTAFILDGNGRLYTNSSIYTPNGDSAMNDTADAVKVLNVDGSGTTISPPTLGTHDGALGTITNVTGNIPLCRASASAPSDVSADGDGAAVSCTRAGALRVNVENAASGGTALNDDAAFTVGTTQFTPAGGTYKSTRDAVDDNDGGAFAMTQKRGLYVSPETVTGDPITDDTANAVKALLVDSAGTPLTQDSQLTGDAALTHSSTTGTAVFARSSDTTPCSAVNADNDAVMLCASRSGEVYVDTAGATQANVTSAASTNSTNVKNAAGRLMGIWLINTTTTVYYLRLYNLASAPTCSSSTGFLVSLPIPPASAAGQAGGFSFQFGPGGLAYTTGISYCITGGSANNDNTNAATGIFGIIGYK